MARPDQEAIEMFMSITGLSEAIAWLKLVENGGDVGDALDAHFNGGGKNLSASDDVEEQMIRAAMDASIREFENHAATQERALRLQGDAGAPIVAPPKSSEVELGKVASSSGGLPAGSSVPQDAEENPLIRNRSTPLSLGSTDLAEATCEEERGRGEESEKKLQPEKELERQLGAKEAALPPEPSLDDENAVTFLIKMPNGSRHGRRFLKSDNLQSLFDFIDTCRVVKPAHYRLVRPHPRRVFSDGESALTLNEVGLTDKQEALFLELI